MKKKVTFNLRKIKCCARKEKFSWYMAQFDRLFQVYSQR